MKLIDARNVRTSLDKQYNLLKVKAHVQQSLTTENQTKIHVNMISMIRYTVLAKRVTIYKASKEEVHRMSQTLSLQSQYLENSTA